MLASNPIWGEIKRWAFWAARNAQLEMIATSVLFPIVECVFVNLYTGAKVGEGTSFGIALVVIGLLHATLLVLLLIRQNTNPVHIATSALEIQEKLDQVTQESAERARRLEHEERERVKKLEDELVRKVEAYRLLRTVLDTLNLQTCQLDPSADDAFSKGLMPIIQRVACAARGTLGVQANQFTIEVYCLNTCIIGTQDEWGEIPPGATEHESIAGYIRLGLFYSSSGLNPAQLNLMESGSAFHWGWYRGVQGTCCIGDDKHVFYQGGEPRPDLYFRRFATVPVNLVCMAERIGLLVITSMQETPFSDDILETMQFLASVISQYIASHQRCVSDWKIQQKLQQEEEEAQKEEDRRKREERKAAKEAGKHADKIDLGVGEPATPPKG